MKFYNTTGKMVPDDNHFGVDLHSWCFGVSYWDGFYYIELGPLYLQMSLGSIK